MGRIQGCCCVSKKAPSTQKPPQQKNHPPHIVIIGSTDKLCFMFVHIISSFYSLFKPQHCKEFRLKIVNTLSSYSSQYTEIYLLIHRYIQPNTNIHNQTT